MIAAVGRRAIVAGHALGRASRVCLVGPASAERPASATVVSSRQPRTSRNGPAGPAPVNARHFKACYSVDSKVNDPMESHAISRLCLLAPTEQDTEIVADFLSTDRKPGDCYCMFGSVGAGKSAFSRAFIRSAADDDDLPVPSPTYLLQNIYNDMEGPPIHHYDLYRLTGGGDMGRLSLDSALSNAVCLIEWAERLQEQDRLTEFMEMAINSLPQAEEERIREFASWQGSVSDEDADDDDESDSQYTDRRWRILSFTAHGKRMAAKLEALRSLITSPRAMKLTNLRLLPEACHHQSV